MGGEVEVEAGVGEKVGAGLGAEVVLGVEEVAGVLYYEE